MVRTQIQLSERQAGELKRVAAERGISMAQLVRDGVDGVLAEDERRRAWKRAVGTIGMIRGDGSNISENHDEYLADAYEDWRSS